MSATIGTSSAANLAFTDGSQPLGAKASTDGHVLTWDSATGTWRAEAAAGGTIGGSTGAVDNAIIRANGAGGSTIQSSDATVDDSGNISAANVGSKSIPTSSATGWTLTNGSGTAGITGGDLVLTLASATIPGSWANTPRGSYSHGRGPYGIVLRARLAALSGGDSADVYFAIGLRRASDGAGWFANIRGNGGYFNLWDGSDRGGTAGINRAALAAGTLWVQIVYANGVTTLYYGTGASEPTTWDLAILSPTVTAFGSDRIAVVTATLDAIGGGSPDTVSVSWDNITVRALGDL
jgi:hypothetical protein